MELLERLKKIKNRYDKVNEQLSDSAITSDREKMINLSRERSDLEEIISAYETYSKIVNDIEGNKEIINSKIDKELTEIAESELQELEEKKVKMEEEIKLLLLPKDPNDNKSIIMEVRAGTGGEEAALFAADLFRMYSRYIEKSKMKMELIDSSPTEIGGFKEIIFLINGRDAYGKFRFESGIHRVQRVPRTEASGRVHTSASTVAVLPEADEVDIQIMDSDLRIDTFCSSGAGGQSVNTTYSAVRITHLPTGLVVQCQDERSQLKNKSKALKVLYARLKEKADQEARKNISTSRKNQIGSGDRSEKIRTYNFPQNRVTYHRIELTLYKLDRVMEGDLDDLTIPLVNHFYQEQLRA